MKAIVLLLFCSAAWGQANVQMCAGCHGAQGEGNAQTGAPRIAGQPKAYLERQLESYADGRRENQVMSPIAKALSPEQRAQLADAFASMRTPSKRSAATGGSAPQRATALATHGDESRQIQACANCHGPGGVGMSHINPYLAGLDAKYLAASLGEWRSGARRTDPSGQMPRIAKSLTDADIKALASYYAAQAAPQPRAVRKPAANRNAESTQPGAGSGGKEGSDVTGSEPRGTQGPGGAGSK